MAKQRTRPDSASGPEPREELPARQESPERAQPSLAGVLGVHPPISVRSHPAGESREGAALFGRGCWGYTPNLCSLPSGGRVQRGRSPLWQGCWGYTPQSLFAPIRRESPERAPPSLVEGVGGTPPISVRSHPAGESREGAALFDRGVGGTPPISVRSHPAGESREGAALFGRGVGGYTPPNLCSLPSGGRVQRGRSPLWWGFGGTPQPLSAPLPAREVGGPPEVGTGAQPCTPTNTELYDRPRLDIESHRPDNGCSPITTQRNKPIMILS